MPDFDIDFCQEGRDRVIDYVKENMVLNQFHKLRLLEPWQQELLFAM